MNFTEEVIKKNIGDRSPLMIYFKELSENHRKIEWMDPQEISKKQALKKKIPNVFSILILDLYFLSLTFNSYEENTNNLQIYDLHIKSTTEHSFQDLLIFNYNEIFSAQIFLLYIIKQYFLPVPLGLSKRESEKFQIMILAPHKKKILEFLKKLIIKRPEDYQEETVAFNILSCFVKFLKNSDKDNSFVYVLSKTIKKSLNQYRFPSLESEYYIFGANKEEIIDFFYRTKFNEYSAQEIVKILIIIDLQLLFKFNRNTQNEISKKNEQRYNFFINFLVVNVLSNTNLKKQTIIIENYYKIADLLYKEKNYSSLLLFFACLSKLELILPKFMKKNSMLQKNYVKESTFFQSLLDGSYEQISNKWKSDLDKNYLSIPFLNYYQRHLNFTCNKRKEDFYLDLGKMSKIYSCFNEIHDIKTICSNKINFLAKNFTKNDIYYFLKKDYKIILRKLITNLEKISNQELENIVLNMAESFENNIV